MNRVFITGGSGFIGSNLVTLLQRSQIEVCNYDQKLPKNPHGRGVLRQGDILDRDALIREITDFKPDILVHLAARCDLNGKTLEDYRANISGVGNIVAAVKKAPSVTRVIFASSRYVHGNEAQPSADDEYSPFTLYGASKVEGEKIVRKSALPAQWTIIRPTSIWGPWFDVPYKTFFETVKRGLYIHPLGQKVFKSFGFVGNVAHQIRVIAAAPSELVHGRTLYVADYTPVEIGAFASLIGDRFNAPPVRHLPLQLLKLIAISGDTAQKFGWRNPPITSFRLNNLKCQMVYDLGPTEKIVGKLPYSTEEGVHATVEWMERHE